MELAQESPSKSERKMPAENETSAPSSAKAKISAAFSSRGRPAFLEASSMRSSQLAGNQRSLTAARKAITVPRSALNVPPPSPAATSPPSPLSCAR